MTTSCDPQETSPPPQRILVWDLPLRIFHWSLAVAVGIAIVSGELGGDMMRLHAQAGLAIIGLVTFRIVWGFVGSSYARFLDFLPTPARIRAYLRGDWQGAGHNPLGACAVFALLGVLGTQAAMGLFGDDEIGFTGPLNRFVEPARALWLTGLHQKLAYVIFALIALHLFAIAFYWLFKKNNLVKPMLSGWKEAKTSKTVRRGSLAGLLLAISAAVAVTLLASGLASR